MTLEDYLQTSQQRHLDELLEFLRIPSVSALSTHNADTRKAAEFVAAKLKDLGFTVAINETPKHPIVTAHYHVDDKLPTVLVYGHYDVQPPDPINLWTSPPFEPVVKDGVIVARGSSDDKGQVYAHIKGAEALIKTTATLPVNLKFLIEGEEEISSPSILPFLEAHLDDLRADTVIISDNAMMAPNTPTITYGLKGIAYIEVRVKTAAMDLHSGAFGGGVPNPINALAKMIAALHDDKGRITVPGFYDAVLDISPMEKAAFAKVPFDEQEFATEIDVTATPGEAGYSLLERLWARPTLDCNGIGGGFQGEGSKTVIANTAMAKISCRLVPNQDPDDIRDKLTAYLKELAPAGVQVEVIDLHGGKPAMSPIESRAVQTAAKALQQVYGKEALFARTGGSIPIVSNLQELLGAEVVLVGFGLETDRVHSPNEKFDLENYYKGIEVSAALLNAFAEKDSSQ
jgi:acetylornithine deacetylase/succinyl-diaminopimelate desuccinylase-like protein